MFGDRPVVRQKKYRSVFKRLGRDQRLNSGIYELPEWLEAAIDTYLTDYHAQAPMDMRELLLVRARYASGSDERDRRAFIRATGRLVTALVVCGTFAAAVFNFGTSGSETAKSLLLTFYGLAIGFYLVIMFYERMGPTPTAQVTELVDVVITDRLDRTSNGRPH
jgi:hypothetical protein